MAYLKEDFFPKPNFMRKLQLLMAGLCLALLYGITACSIPEIDLVDESENWNPDIGVPVLTLALGMEDLLDSVQSSDILDIQTDSLLVVTYKESINIDAQANIPPIPDFPIPIGSFDQSLPNPTGGDFRLDIIDVKQGQLHYTISNPYQEPVQVDIQLEDISLGGNMLEWMITIPAAASPTDPVIQEGMMDLDGYRISFQSGFKTQYTATLMTSGAPVSLHPFALEMTGLSFSYMEGYFGQFEIEIPGDSLYFGFLDSWEYGEIAFVEPEIKFSFHNTYGVPVTITSDTLAFKTFLRGDQPIQSLVLGNGLPLNFPSPNQVGQAQTTTLTLNAGNSNIVNVASGVPYQLDYKLVAEANPDNDMNIINHLTDNPHLDIDVEVDIPLYGTAKDFTFESIYDIELESLKEVERGGVKLIAENGFPLDVFVQVYFLDEQETLIDSLYTDQVLPVVASAKVDDTGKVNEKVTTERFASLDEARFAAIVNQASKVKVSTTIETPDDGSQPVRIFSFYDLVLKMGILAGF
jgi:hypothetical protein